LFRPLVKTPQTGHAVLSHGAALLPLSAAARRLM